MKYYFLIDTCVIYRAALPSDQCFEETISCARFFYDLLDDCNGIIMSDPVYKEYQKVLSQIPKREIRSFNPFTILDYAMERTNKFKWVKPNIDIKKINIHEKDQMLFQTLAGLHTSTRYLVTLEENILELKEDIEIINLNIKILNIEEAKRLIRSD